VSGASIIKTFIAIRGNGGAGIMMLKETPLLGMCEP
jgi:hypothetical protein